MSDEQPRYEFQEIRVLMSPRRNPYVWLTWAMRRNKVVELRCISFKGADAARAKEYLEKNEKLKADHDKQEFIKMTDEQRAMFKFSYANPVIQCWIERVEADHVFGAGMLAEIMAIPEKMPPLPEEPT